LTPTAVVLISNFGTSMAYNGANGWLRKAVIRFDDAGYADDERAHEGTSLDNDTPLPALPQDEAAVDELTAVRAVQLPKGAGWVLITAGVVGLVVPGVLGTPFMLAGALILAPGGTKLLSRWVGHSRMCQIGRFLDNLERRYPHRRRGNAD
jgi:hypothetical protein